MFVPQRARALARLRLHPDWRRILRRAWSVRLMALAALLSGGEVVCSVLTANPPLPPAVFAALSGAVTIAAFIARFVAQRDFPQGLPR